LTEFAALVKTFRTREEDVIGEIVGIFPEVGGVRLADVNDIERRVILVLLVEFVEGGNLPPERRSSVAAEDEYDGLLAAQEGQLKMALVVGALEREIGRGVANAECAFARAHPERPQRKHEERDVREVAHGARNFFMNFFMEEGREARVRSTSRETKRYTGNAAESLVFSEYQVSEASVQKESLAAMFIVVFKRAARLKSANRFANGRLLRRMRVYVFADVFD